MRDSEEKRVSMQLGIERTRISGAYQMMDPCSLCPRRCRARRGRGEQGICGEGGEVRIAGICPHFGEEDCFVGKGGSGAIFFTGCPLTCVFCQNAEIAKGHVGVVCATTDLMEAMLRLQELGLENVNLVTPTQFIPQILEACVMARNRGLAIPYIYNTSGYESCDALQLLEGVIDIYLPDFKFWTPHSSAHYLGVEDYSAYCKFAIKEMWRQVGDLRIENGRATRGLLVRHLVMPGLLEESQAILRFLAQEVSPAMHVNIMGGYRPLRQTEMYPELALPTSVEQVSQVREFARSLGLTLVE